MAGNREREINIHIRFSGEEYKAFLDGYEKSGMRTQREFILAMCLRGYIVKVDTSGLNRVAEELNRIGVNINQIAHKVNSTSALSAPELRVLQKGMNDIYGIIQKEFARYRNQAVNKPMSGKSLN